MQVLVLNDTRADPNPGCQATVSMLVRHLGVALDAEVRTRPRGEGYELFDSIVAAGRAHSPADWYHAVTRLAHDSALAEAIGAADLVVANLEGTFHHHAVGALALGGAIAVAHRAGTPVWAVNGTVEAIDPWLLAATLMPASHVAVREPRSARWLAARGVIATAAADAAFLAETLGAQREGAGATTKSVLYTPGVVQSTTASPAAAVAEILGDLTMLTDAGWEPVFVQLEDREAPLAAAVRAQGWPTTDAQTVPWPAFGTWLRRFALVVSGRYHVLIFAAMAGVPAIARRSNTHKIEGLLDLLGRPGAIAPDAAALRALLARGAPAPIDVGVIRRCQTLAGGNIAPLGARRTYAMPSPATAAFPVIEGLDLSAASALPRLLSSLRRSGPDQFLTSVATSPGDTRHDGLWPLASAATWRQRFEGAGFAVRHEHTVPSERAIPPDWPVARHWRAANPLRDPAIGERRVFTVQRSGPATTSAAEPARAALDLCPSLLREPGVHVRFVISSFAEFERLAPTWAHLPASCFDVVLPNEPRDAVWHTVQRALEGTCLARGIAVANADRPSDVTWLVGSSRQLLVTTAVPTPGRWCSFHGAFLTAARTTGWTSLVLAPRSAATSRPSVHRAPLGALLGDWVAAFAARVLTIETSLEQVVEAASCRPDILFLVREANVPRPTPRLPGNIAVLDDVACLVLGVSTFALAHAVDAVASSGSRGVAIAAASGRPVVTLVDLARGTEVAPVAPMSGSDPIDWTVADARAVASDLDAMAASVSSGSDSTAGATPAPLRLALFGASSLGRDVAACVSATPGIVLSMVFDNDPTKAGTFLDGAPIMPPDSAALDEVDVVLVSSMHGDAIARQVTALGHGHKLLRDRDALGLQRV